MSVVSYKFITWADADLSTYCNQPSVNADAFSVLLTPGSDKDR